MSRVSWLNRTSNFSVREEPLVGFLTTANGAGQLQSEKRDFMSRIGLPEMIVILFIVILVFGSSKLPELARGLGQAIKGFKEGAAGDEKDTTTKPQ